MELAVVRILVKKEIQVNWMGHTWIKEEKYIVSELLIFIECLNN